MYVGIVGLALMLGFGGVQHYIPLPFEPPAPTTSEIIFTRSVGMAAQFAASPRKLVTDDLDSRA